MCYRCVTDVIQMRYRCALSGSSECNWAQNSQLLLQLEPFKLWVRFKVSSLNGSKLNQDPVSVSQNLLTLMFLN